MSLCINPNCPQPDHPGNVRSDVCQSCHSDLLWQGCYRATRLLSDNTGFGTVYEADDRGTAKILKVLKINAPKAIELFKQESQVLSQLHHPGIPKIDSYFTLTPVNSKKPLYCLVMEKIQGQNLQAWMHNNPPLDCALAIDWLKQLIEILACVHQKNFFHRDIKPANIMLRPNGQLALIDFGTAREITQTYLAKMGGRSGITSIASAGYTPLEQNNGKAVPQSDFYAVGRTFVYLLTGKHPTEFDEDPGKGILIWQSEVRKAFPPLLTLIDEMMAPFPAQRPKDTKEILERLVEIEKTYNLYRSHPLGLAGYRDGQKADAIASSANPLRDRFADGLASTPAPLFRDSEAQAASLASPHPQTWFKVGGGVLLLAIAGSAVGFFSIRSRPVTNTPIMPLTLALPPRSNLPLPEAPPTPLAESSPSPAIAPKPTPPSFEGKDKGVILVVKSLSQKKNDVILEINLTNQGPRAVKFLYNFLELTDNLERELSAVPEGLPDELPANGKTVSGTLKIPAALLIGAESISLKLIDPEDNLNIQIPRIPIAKFPPPNPSGKPGETSLSSPPSSVVTPTPSPLAD
jgi:serine/threonine protein kinase